MTRKPNFTQIPNEFLDNAFIFSASEFMVLTIICRQTYGWHKDIDKISLSQFMKKTNLSKPTIIKAIDGLIEKGCVIKNTGNHETISDYSIQPSSKILLDLVKKFHEASKKSLHTKETIQNKEKQKKQDFRSFPATPPKNVLDDKSSPEHNSNLDLSENDSFKEKNVQKSKEKDVRAAGIHKNLTAYFHEQMEADLGSKPIWHGARFGKAIKDIVKAADGDLEYCKKKIAAYRNKMHKDDFYRKRGFDPESVVWAWNKLSVNKD